MAQAETPLTKEYIDALHTRVAEQVPLAKQMIEYGCTDRSEVIIGHLLEWGVHESALGRISTYKDVRALPEEHTFRFADPLHGDAFQQAWSKAFGDDVPRVLRLTNGELSYDLDVSGEIQWGIGHIAPTITAVDGSRWVIDPVLSPEAPLSPQAWREAQNTSDAALIWGQLSNKPKLLEGEHLSFDDVAKQLSIPADSAWHPKHWAGYSFVGAQKDADGNAMPDWPVADDLGKKALKARAGEKLSPLLAYQQLREKFITADAFMAYLKLKAKPAEDGVITLPFSS